MTVRSGIDGVLRTCGEAAVVYTPEEAGGTATRAVIQSICSTTEQGHLPTALEVWSEEKYLYLGRRDCPLVAGSSWILWRGQKLDVQSAHPIYVGGRTSHWWGILVPRGEDDGWEQD